MDSRFDRSAKLLGFNNISSLSQKTVAVFGIGGVGSFTVEALARTGLGHLILIDFDTIDITNINRQIMATTDTVGLIKAEVMAQRVLSIHPECQVKVMPITFNEETSHLIEWDKIDYIVDAIDMVSSKLLLITLAKHHDIPIISAMGAGNKLNPSMLSVVDISKTKVCPLARVMRQELRKRGIHHLKVVYSPEPPLKPLKLENDHASMRREVPGSVSFVPSVSGLLIASEVIKDLIKEVPCES